MAMPITTAPTTALVPIAIPLVLEVAANDITPSPPVLLLLLSLAVTVPVAVCVEAVLDPPDTVCEDAVDDEDEDPDSD